MAEEHSPTTVPATLHSVALDRAALVRLQNSLLDAFDYDGLTQLVRNELSPSLAAIVSVQGRNLTDITAELVLWALHNPDIGLQGLLAAAVSANPGNPKLKELKQQWQDVTFTLPACPYPGMRPFTTEEQACFFGRESDVDEAVDKLRRSSFLAIIGSSGSGKSSLLAAGILPALKASHYFPGTTWLVRTVRPTEFAEHGFGSVESAPVAEQHGQRQLIVVDQMEELYTPAFTAYQRKAFEQALLAKITNPDIMVILALRTDFYANLMDSQLWDTVKGKLLALPPLRGEPLRAAIAQPARNVGVELDADLVERLLADAGDEPGVLPFVQETLLMLWGSAQNNLRIGLNHYANLVGGKGGRSGLQVALATHAGSVYTLELAGDEQRSIARRILLRLVQFGEGRPDTRRQQTVDELRSGMEQAQAFDMVLETLTAHRLLTLSDEARRVDLAHESLIAGWPLLNEWIKERKDAERTRRRLEERANARQHLRQSGKDGGLLDAADLAAAEKWAQTPSAQDLGISPQITALLTDSRKKIRGAIVKQRALLALLFLSMLIALGYMGLQLLQLDATRKLQQSITAAQNGHRDAAISLFNQALAENPDLSVTAEEAITGTTRKAATGIVRQGEAMAAANNLTGAEHEFKVAATLEPPPDTLLYVHLPPGTVVLGLDKDQVSTIEQQLGNPVGGLGHAAITTTTPVAIGGFWMMRTEVTNAEYKDCVAARKCDPPQYNGAWALDSYARLPVTGVDIKEAKQYADWVGGRLPTPEEWEYACKGKPPGIYPWGIETPTTTLLNSIDSGFDTTREVGSYADGTTTTGLYDMAGNVKEWTNAAHTLKNGVVVYIVKGSSYADSNSNLYCAYTMDSPSGPDPSIGFRVIIPDS